MYQRGGNNAVRVQPVQKVRALRDNPVSPSENKKFNPLWNIGFKSRQALLNQVNIALTKKFPKASIFTEKIKKALGNNNNAINTLIKSYGGIEVILKGASFASNNISFFKNREKIKTLNKIFTTTTFLYDLCYKLKQAFPKRPSTKYDPKVNYIREEVLKGLGGGDYDRQPIRDAFITEADIKKILKIKESNIIITLYDFEKRCEVTEAKFEGSYCIKIEDPSKDLWEEPIVVSFKIDALINGIKNYIIEDYYDLYDGDRDGFECFLMSNRVEDMDYKNKVIFYNDGELELRPRRKIGNFILDTRLHDKLVTDIKNRLDKNKRYGVVLVGPNGTGKTTALISVEERIVDYPIIEANAINLSKIENLGRFTNFLKGIGRCVVLLDEFDSIGLEQKDDKFSGLLTMLDGSKNKFGVVTIMVVNNIKKINKSVLRTGRCDRVIEVLPSTKKINIDKSIISSYIKVIGVKDDKFVKNFKTSLPTFLFLKKSKLVQSDYCEIMTRLSMTKLSYSNYNIRVIAQEVVRENKMKNNKY